MLLSCLLVAHKNYGYDTNLRNMKWGYKQIKDFLRNEYLEEDDIAENMQEEIFKNINNLLRSVSSISDKYPTYFCGNYGCYFVEVWLQSYYLEKQEKPLYRKGSIKLHYKHSVRFQYIKWF